MDILEAYLSSSSSITDSSMVDVSWLLESVNLDWN